LFNDAYGLIEADAPTVTNWFDNSSIGYLPFINGALDLKKFEMKHHDPKYKLMNRIERVFNCNNIETHKQNADAILEKVFSRPITDIEKRDYLLEKLARGFAGEYLDKQFVWLIGEGDAGKVLIVELFTYSMQSFIGMFNAENLLNSAGNRNKESERKYTFLYDIYDKRIAFSSELTLNTETNKTKFGITKKLESIDGNVIKKLVSSTSR